MKFLFFILYVAFLNVFKASSDIYLRKSVKSYNKNAGYGYFDGLESLDSK